MNAFILTLIFIFFEFCDIALNPQTDFKSLVNSYIARYQKSPFLFFATQFNFLFLTFCIFYFGIYALFVLYAFYVLDLLTKLIFIKNSFSNDENSEINQMLDMNFKFTKMQRIFISLACSAVFFVLVI